MNFIFYERPRYKRTEELEKGQIIQAQPMSSIEKIQQRYIQNETPNIPIIGYIMGTAKGTYLQEHTEELVVGHLYPPQKQEEISVAYSGIKRWTDNEDIYKTIGTFTHIDQQSTLHRGLEDLLIVPDENRILFGNLLQEFVETMEIHYR